MRIVRFFGHAVPVILALTAGTYVGIYMWGSLAVPEVKPVALHSSPNPAHSDIDEVCLPFVLTHGAKGEKVTVAGLSPDICIWWDPINCENF
ncbi:MAG: hypothetical protein NZ553_10125 [Caldilinea sp.]|nr:hypothetical protein [Caldilinea sp.]MDW8440819.1 hypothetical protein [Caldilineaceae bacterium]